MHLIRNKNQWETEEETSVETLEAKHHAIILFNDDVNTFDHVIEMLVTYCGHDPVQAEQCAFIIHYKGKATVKTAPYSVLKPQQEALCDRGLSAVIEGGAAENS